jgi:hypothetical protein
VRGVRGVRGLPTIDTRCLGVMGDDLENASRNRFVRGVFNWGAFGVSSERKLGHEHKLRGHGSTVPQEIFDALK